MTILFSVPDDEESSECDRFHSSTEDLNVLNCAKALVRAKRRPSYPDKARKVKLWSKRLDLAVAHLEAAEKREKDRLSEMVSFTEALDRGEVSISEISPGEHLFTRKPKDPR